MHIIRSLLAFSLVVVLTASAADETVAVATLYWEPYITTNSPDGGPATLIVKTAFQRGGLNSEIKIMPWVNAIEKSQSGEYHAIFPAYYSVERDRKYLISNPILCSPVVLLARASDDIQYSGLASLEPYRIGVVAGYANAEAFDDAKQLNKVTNKSDLDNLIKLKAGDVDLAVFDKLVAVALLHQHSDILGDFEDYHFLSPTLGNRDMYVMFPKCLPDSKMRMNRFNKGLEKMRQDGTIETIIRKHGFH